MLNERIIKSKERNSLNNIEFGIPDKRKYPLIDKKHVIKAIQLFKFADEEDRKILAVNIKNKANKFNIFIHKDNLIHTYL